MATNPAYTLNVSLYDQSSEIATMRANRAGDTDLSTGLPLILTDFVTAIAAYVSFDATDLKNVKSNATRRVSNDLQGVGNREDKWLLQFQDATTLAPYNVEVPCRAGNITLTPGTDFLPEADVANFRTQAEALFLSPDGNAGNLLTVTLIGRRS